MTRRSIALSSLCAVGGLALSAHATRVGPRAFESVQVRLSLHDWPPGLDGTSIALVSDIHIGRRRGRAWTCPALPAALRAVREAKPDLLVLCGDLGFKRWEPEDLARVATLFETPNRVAVLGNHDYAHGTEKAARLRVALEEQGFSVLVNEVIQTDIRGHHLWIAGLGDATSHHDDMVALTDALGHSRPAILLSHTPDAVIEAPAVFDLALSGHTHGGQVAIPLVNRLILRRTAHSRFDRGLYRINGIPMYVSKGLGMVGYRVRFRARPEVVFLHLHAATGAPDSAPK